MLNRDLSSMSNYFKYNKLIINIDKNKTHMLFGTAKRLQLNPKQLELYHDLTKINVTKTYKYFGSKLGPHLNLKSQRKS